MTKNIIILFLIGIILTLLLWSDKESKLSSATLFNKFQSVTQSNYENEWKTEAQKPEWWDDIETPPIPEIKTAADVFSFSNTILTEPCCDSNKYKHERKVASKVMYAIVRDKEKYPNAAATALGYVSTNMVKGWDREKIIEFYLKHFYWENYTHCSSCMVGDLSWNKVADLAYIYNKKGDIKKGISLIEKYLSDRGHELHQRYHLKAQGTLAKYRFKLGHEDAIPKLESYIDEIKTEINNKDIKYYYKELLKTCKRLKKVECTI